MQPSAPYCIRGCPTLCSPRRGSNRTEPPGTLNDLPTPPGSGISVGVAMADTPYPPIRRPGNPYPRLTRGRSCTPLSSNTLPLFHSLPGVGVGVAMEGPKLKTEYCPDCTQDLLARGTLRANLDGGCHPVTYRGLRKQKSIADPF